MIHVYVFRCVLIIYVWVPLQEHVERGGRTLTLFIWESVVEQVSGRETEITIYVSYNEKFLLVLSRVDNQLEGSENV